jgi:hypothetical protein
VPQKVHQAGRKNILGNMRKTKFDSEKVKKAALIVAFLIIPGSLLAVAAYAAYKKMRQGRAKQKSK